MQIAVIGSGFSSLAAATTLSASGHTVYILEKNEQTGGRARRFFAQGYTFDMGPSWYWMPDVFEKYFERFGKQVSDYYELVRIDPSYRVIFEENRFVDIPANYTELRSLFEKLEPGACLNLDAFLAQAKYKYNKGMNDLVHKPSRSLLEFADLGLLWGILKMDVFSSMHAHLRKFFKHPDIIKLLEFPVLFLGAIPKNTPALYSLMNYADISLGTWYPKKGMYQIVEAMTALAKEKGVSMHLNEEVLGFETNGNQVIGVKTKSRVWPCDAVVAGADYHHVEQSLLKADQRNYTEKYWDSRTMAPSSLIFYLGVNKKLDRLEHHNLFFDEDFTLHAHEIYTEPKWPSKPLFYVSVVSKTDPESAPEGCENVFILIPVAPALADEESTREHYYNMVMDRLEKFVGYAIRPHVEYKRSYAHQDFINDYHAFKGNAYGLANTLMQTAILKPALKSKKLKNLYFTGQLTVPGPGVPPSIISGQVVASELMKDLK